jgi:hypothetical protein
VARVEAAPEKVDDHGQQIRIRALTGAIALVLVVTAVVLVTRHQRVTRSIPAYCTQMETAKNLSVVLAIGDTDQIQRAVAQLDRAVGVAPVDIESPTRVLATYADGLAAALRTGGGTEAALAAAVRRQEPQIPRVQAAGHEVVAWTQANCGVTLRR